MVGNGNQSEANQTLKPRYLRRIYVSRQGKGPSVPRPLPASIRAHGGLTLGGGNRPPLRMDSTTLVTFLANTPSRTHGVGPGKGRERDAPAEYQDVRAMLFIWGVVIFGGLSYFIAVSAKGL
jgi:hypothetical protein